MAYDKIVRQTERRARQSSRTFGETEGSNRTEALATNALSQPRCRIFAKSTRRLFGGPGDPYLDATRYRSRL